MDSFCREQLMITREKNLSWIMFHFFHLKFEVRCTETYKYIVQNNGSAFVEV